MPPALPPHARPLRPRIALPALGAAILLTIAAALVDRPAGSWGSLYAPEAERYTLLALLAGTCCAAAISLVRGPTPLPRGTVPFILGVGLIARLMVVAAPPMLSTDLYRYVWDGRVQAAGINPYRFIPDDPALAPLRDDAPGPGAIYPNINRRDTAPTIYPPAAQLLFAAVGRLWSSIYGIKVAMLLLDGVTTAALLALLRTAGRPLAFIVIWAWNPLPIWEFAGAGHVDAGSCAFIALAMLAAAHARRGWAGSALGVAVLFKLLPAALFPALWRRWDWRTPLAAALTIAAGYAVYASAGRLLLGFLGGYAAEEGVGGNGALLLRLLGLLGPLPPWTDTAYRAAALLFLAAVAAAIGLRHPLPQPPAARADVIARGAILLAAAILAVLSPHYPWYLAMLIVPATITPAWSALWPGLAGPLLYLDVDYFYFWLGLVFLPALLLIPLDRRAWRTRPTARLP